MTNLEKFKTDITLSEKEQIQGIALGILQHERINKSQMLLVLKMIYQYLDFKDYKTDFERDAVNYIKEEISTIKNLETDYLIKEFKK